MQKYPPLILGSNSPRRKEILGHFSYPFTVISPNFDEESVPFLGDPEAYVLSIAKGKGESLAAKYPNDLILTADTTVYFKGDVFNKASSREEAEAMFTTLSKTGEPHSVFTALVLYYQGQEHSRVEETKVWLNPLTKKQIDRYYEKMNYLDKAGAYAIQEGGGLAVKKIEGCFHNVRGLPVNALHSLFNEVGVDLWDFLA